MSSGLVLFATWICWVSYRNGSIDIIYMIIWTGWTVSSPLLLWEVQFVIPVDCMIFLSLFLDAIKMPMSTVYFLAQLYWIFLTTECFPLSYDLIGTLSLPLASFHIFLLFLVTPSFAVAIQLCMDRIPILKNTDADFAGNSKGNFFYLKIVL